MLGVASAESMGILSIIYALAVLLPGIGASIRRLHDTGRSGWWLLLGLLLFVGHIVLVIFMAQDSAPGKNQYGPNPKATGTDDGAGTNRYV